MNNNHFLAPDPNIFFSLSLLAAVSDPKSDPGLKYVSAEPTDLFYNKSQRCEWLLLEEGQCRGIRNQIIWA